MQEEMIKADEEDAEPSWVSVKGAERRLLSKSTVLVDKPSAKLLDDESLGYGSF